MLQVLRDVFNSFHDVLTHNGTQWFNLNREFDLERVIFPYDGKDWCGTIDCRYANYEKRRVLFTNIKLPNDGFYYGIGYCDGDRDDIVETDEVQEVVNDLLRVFPTDLEEGPTYVNYKLVENRFEIYQWNNDESKCLIIKFEYGSYESFKDKKQFTRKRPDKLAQESDKVTSKLENV